MTKNELKKYVEALIAAPSCCPEAKDAGEKYLAALGTEEEAAAGKNLLAMLGSDAGKQFFGEEKAAAMTVHAEEIKAAGAKYCDCPACAAAEVILNNRDVVLA